MLTLRVSHPKSTNIRV